MPKDCRVYVNLPSLCETFLRQTAQFGLISLAEGIETEAQATWLVEHGCLMGQGFLFAEPAPLAILLPMIGDRSHAAAARTRGETPVS